MNPSTPRPPPVHPPSTCALCAHPDRASLDAMLLAGAAVAAVARSAEISRTSVRRHRDAEHHIATPPPLQLPPAVEVGPPIDVPVIDLRTGRALPPVPPEPPAPEGDPDPVDLVAELAQESIYDASIATRERKGARRSALELRREATRTRLERLWANAESFLEDAAADVGGEDGPDHSGRARLVSACNAVLQTIARILGELDPEAGRAVEREDVILEVLLSHPDAAQAVAVRLRRLDARPSFIAT